FTLDRDSQKYRLIISAEYTTSNKNDVAYLEVTLDSEQLNEDCFKPTSAGVPHLFCTMIPVVLDSGLHVLSLNAKSTNGNTVSVKRARLTVDKF
ncbi:unnamed protein product, partial [marine sediment metagenome]